MGLLLRLLFVIGVFLFSACDRAEAAQERKRPTVRLVATGGTIANSPGDRLTADDLVALIPSLDRNFIVETEQFANLPSSSVTLDQWLELAQRLNVLFAERRDLTGVVVTSGTDTLEETAYFLNLTVNSDRPVVVVGAMRTPDAIGYDGTANLLDGFRVAASPASRGRGVLVVLNNQIHSARDVTKTHAQRLDTFDSGLYGALGVVDTDRIVYYRRPSRRHTHRSEFDPATIDSLPQVDIVMSYLGASGDLIAAAHENGAKGLVVAAAGAGSATPDQSDAIKKLIEEGVVVVVATRTGAGRIPSRLNSRDTSVENSDWRYARNRVSGEDLSPIKARILLMLALTKTTDGAEIQRMFMVY